MHWIPFACSGDAGEKYKYPTLGLQLCKHRIYLLVWNHLKSTNIIFQYQVPLEMSETSLLPEKFVIGWFERVKSRQGYKRVKSQVWQASISHNKEGCWAILLCMPVFPSRTTESYVRNLLYILYLMIMILERKAKSMLKRQARRNSQWLSDWAQGITRT